MGFLDKVRNGLKKTKESLIKNIETVVIGYAKIDDDFLEDLEMVLLSGDLGVRTTDYLMRQIRRGVTEGMISSTNEVMPFMEKTVVNMLTEDGKEDISHHPEVYLVVGVNGVGKTTTIGKLSAQFRKEGKKVLLAAADTFRAAASEQLSIWAKRTGADFPAVPVPLFRFLPSLPHNGQVPSATLHLDLQENYIRFHTGRSSAPPMSAGEVTLSLPLHVCLWREPYKF